MSGKYWKAIPKIDISMESTYEMGFIWAKPAIVSLIWGRSMINEGVSVSHDWLTCLINIFRQALSRIDGLDSNRIATSSASRISSWRWHGNSIGGSTVAHLVLTARQSAWLIAKLLLSRCRVSTGTSVSCASLWIDSGRIGDGNRLRASHKDSRRAYRPRLKQ